MYKTILCSRPLVYVYVYVCMYVCISPTRLVGEVRCSKGRGKSFEDWLKQDLEGIEHAETLVVCTYSVPLLLHIVDFMYVCVFMYVHMSVCMYVSYTCYMY